jgi:hypothetical protein
MALSVAKDITGPIWPLGLIVVTVPGTPVAIMSLVDPSLVNAPSQAASTTNSTLEYTPACQQIQIQGFNAATHGLQNNTGNIYLVKKLEATAGGGNRDDYGVMVAVILPGQTLIYGSAATNLNVFSPYQYYVDADNANDSALISLIIQ